MNPHDDLRTERCQEPGAWLGAPGSDMAALPDGLWVRPAQSRVHPEAAQAWLCSQSGGGHHARAVLPGRGLTEPRFPRL